MSEPDSIILRYLREIDAKMDLVRADVHDVKVRMTHVEEGLAGVHRRLDRVDERLDRLERRAGLVDAG